MVRNTIVVLTIPMVALHQKDVSAQLTVIMPSVPVDSVDIMEVLDRER